MKILLTGGAGFIGSNVADAYIELGHEVWILDNLSTGSKNNINKKAKFIEMDIRSSELENIIKTKNFDIINHHAAQIDVRKSVQNPLYDADINILGSLNIYQNAHKYGVKKVIFISSGGAIYGECLKPKTENDTKTPLSPYGVAKYSNEFYLDFYSKIHRLKYTTLRYANVYGPRQNPKGEAGVVSIFSTNMLENKQSYIYGDGSQKRDYIFVGDVVKANIKALSGFDNQAFNIGTGIATTTRGIYTALQQIYNYNKPAVYTDERPGELTCSVLNIDKMQTELEIKPKPLLTGLQLTAEYYKDKN
ncbi:MAG: NAD-dependent epimerase/dehydratase family protein [bacterium]|nr:NAD-dependent epimerase/dehydratase family protein [bacterium]